MEGERGFGDGEDGGVGRFVVLGEAKDDGVLSLSLDGVLWVLRLWSWSTSQGRGGRTAHLSIANPLLTHHLTNVLGSGGFHST